MNKLTILMSLMLSPLTLYAVTITNNFQVSVNVDDDCVVSSPNNLIFGTYTPGNGALAGVTSILVACTKGTNYTIALNQGITQGSNLAQRRLGNGLNSVEYNLYTTDSYTTIWGDGSGVTSTTPGVGIGFATPNTYMVYGALPDSVSNQNQPSGLYTDTITVTVTY